ncbi:NADH-ubiquinone oxidoreductase 29.9 kDa subunit [Apiospora marii]|uniref:NADH-ubiquinone oxidoreductase 29.9 kDa subunit n=1 Tax=Apiospora marii TaxID=335849 RepID=UPI00312E7843
MRRTLRLLADVKPAATRYLNAGNPTGLTGLYTATSPRSTLLYLYNTTLEKLQAAPETSLYRQSVEALTKHRKSIIEAAEPPGHAEWAARAKAILAQHPDGFKIENRAARDGARMQVVQRGGQTYMMRHAPQEKDVRHEEWDGEIDEGAELEGPRSEAERADQELIFERQPMDTGKKVKWEAEPQLTADQVEEIETKIGAGLIEEVIEVAQAELKLVDTMVEAKVWEPLEEKPVEGQWTYFER